MGCIGKDAKCWGTEKQPLFWSSQWAKSVGAAIWGKLSLDKDHAGAFLEWVLGNSWALESLLTPQKF